MTREQATTRAMRKQHLMTMTTTSSSNRAKSSTSSTCSNMKGMNRYTIVTKKRMPEAEAAEMETISTVPAKENIASEQRQDTATVPETSPSDLRDKLFLLMRDGAWKQIEDLCEQHPSLARCTIDMVCQGENSACLPIHYASGQKETPVSTIDALVKANPSSLLAPESSGARLPLHLAVLKGAPLSVVRYLCKAQAKSLAAEDQEGNLPLHYASMYSSDEIIALLIQAYPEACSHANNSDRLPLHLLCARCWDQQNVISVDTFKLVVETNPSALQAEDRRARLPLHVACSSEPRADVLHLLISLYPEALLVTDKSKLTPLEMAKKFTASHENNVVLAFLQDCTNRERRKKYKFLAPFKHVSYKIAGRPSKKTGKQDIDALKNLHYCYG